MRVRSQKKGTTLTNRRSFDRGCLKVTEVEGPTLAVYCSADVRCSSWSRPKGPTGSYTSYVLGFLRGQYHCGGRDGGSSSSGGLGSRLPRGIEVKSDASERVSERARTSTAESGH